MIAGRITLKEAVWTDQSTNLTFLPAATNSRLMYSSDILAADATRSFLKIFSRATITSWLICTPLMPIVDTRATSVFVDCYIYVIEWGRTKSDAVKYAFRDAQNISENMLGIVLNKADINQLRRLLPDRRKPLSEQVL